MKTNQSTDSSAHPRRPTWRYFISIGWLVTCIAIVIAGQLTSRKKDPKPNLPMEPSVGELAEIAPSQQLENDNKVDTVNEFIAQADSIPIVDGTDNQLETISFNVDSPNGRVLIVRGIMTVFSLGLNEIGKELQNQGYDVRVTTVARSVLEAKKMRAKAVRANDNAPVIIIGHSLGADRGPQLAALFAEENLPVDLMVLLDSTMPGTAPSNVYRCVNYYQSKSAANIFKGKQIDSLSKRTEVVNVNIQSLSRDETANINHFNIDSNLWIQQLLIGTVQNGTQSTTASEFKRYIDRFADQHIEPQNDVKSARTAEWSNLSDEPSRK